MVGMPTRNVNSVAATRFSQPPIENQGFPERSKHNVVWLDIAMNNVVRVGIGDCLADRDKTLQELTELDIVQWPLDLTFAYFGDSLRKTKLVSISPVTSTTIRQLGLPVAAEAATATTDGILEALVHLAADRSNGKPDA